jgi:bidirectional [NiFe] hydrogenase diaphorase subunit
MSEIILNGRHMEAGDGQTVLDVARKNGVHIPTLCHHPGLGPYGACRLCLIEVKKGSRPGLTSSCSLPATDGLVAETDSPAVIEARKLVVGLLLARASESKEIRAIATSLGAEAIGAPKKDELCILCGRCVRACKALGVNAIAFAGRGGKRRVTAPFDKPSAQCMACLACVTICPTGAIKAKITPWDVEVVQWRTRLMFQRCIGCGKPFVTERQRDLVDRIVASAQQPCGELCSRCRRLRTAGRMASAAPSSDV